MNIVTGNGPAITYAHGDHTSTRQHNTASGCHLDDPIILYHFLLHTLLQLATSNALRVLVLR